MIYKVTQRLEYINHLISQKRTGPPKALAEKLGISERAWYKLRDELVNDLELPIAYCNYRKTYYYTVDGTFEIGFKRMNTNDTAKISGGFGNYSSGYQWTAFGVQ